MMRSVVMMMVMEEDLEMPRWLCCCCLDEWRKLQVVEPRASVLDGKKDGEVSRQGRKEKGKGNLQTRANG